MTVANPVYFSFAYAGITYVVEHEKTRERSCALHLYAHIQTSWRLIAVGTARVEEPLCHPSDGEPIRDLDGIPEAVVAKVKKGVLQGWHKPPPESFLDMRFPRPSYS